MEARSTCLARRDHREVNIGLGDLVDVVRPGVERDVQNDLDHLRVVVAGGLDGVDICLAHKTAGYDDAQVDRKSTRLNSSHANISYAVFCLKKKNKGVNRAL